MEFTVCFNNIMNKQIFLIQIHLLTAIVFAKCSFTVDGNDRPIPTDREPSSIGTLPPCPFFDNQDVCCVPSQVSSMANDFKSIDATFGSDGGGCDLCGSNMKAFWCHYTCSPRQADFVKYTGYQNITDPRNSSNTLEVMLVELAVHPGVACEVYSSCARTSFASQVSAMQSPGGFFSFQGEQAASEGGQLIKVVFREEDSLLINNVERCNRRNFSTTVDENNVTHYWDSFGYEIKQPCDCNTCDESCSAEANLYEPPGVLSGFEGYYVLIAWGWSILAGVGVTLWRKKNEREPAPYEEPLKAELP